MKIKNNTKNLIPRKLIGGLIPKFQNASGKLFTRLEYERRYSNRNYNKAYLLNGKWHRAILNRDKNGNETVTLQTWKPLPKDYYVKDGGIYEKTGLGDIRVDTYKGSRYEAGKPAPNHIPPVDHSVTQAEIDEVKKLNAPKDKPTNTKLAGTRGNGSRGGTRGSGTRGNARTTAKPAATTFTESPTNITDQAWLDARNAAMQRGWGTYNYNGLTYKFTGDEYKLAANNWRNRRKAGYQAEGILNLPGINVPDNLVIDNNEAREIESTVPLTQQLVKPVNTKTTPYTFLYQRGTLAKNPEITREALWQATQAVRNGDRDASYYGESSDLVSQLANANQDSAKNYIYNLWNTNNDVATQAGRKNYTESQGLTFGEPTTLFSWLNDVQKFLNENKRFSKAKQGTKLIPKGQWGLISRAAMEIGKRVPLARNAARTVIRYSLKRDPEGALYGINRGYGLSKNQAQTAAKEWAPVYDEPTPSLMSTVGTMARRLLPIAAVLTPNTALAATMPKDENGVPRGLTYPKSIALSRKK